MARPCEPSEAATALAVQIISQVENDLRSETWEKLSNYEQIRFKLNNAATGKGPAIRTDSLDTPEEMQNQALMNHVSTYHALP